MFSSVYLIEYAVMDESFGDAGRLFLAAVPDANTALQIHHRAGILRRAHNLEGRLIEPGGLHVSLFFLGGLPEQRVRMACAAAADVRSEAFEVSFDRAVSFRGKPGNRPFVLFGGDGLRRLTSFRRMLATAMTQEGLRRRANTNFTPHVTLLYDARDVEEHPIAPIGWTVREFVLIHSMRGHVHLGRWPLRT
jgi:RNA 2',3'-cyclic 3'-phosphodiesterase